MKRKGPTNKLHLPRAALTLAFTWAIVYILGLIWSAMEQSGGTKKLHEQVMRMWYPGFSMTFGGVIIGLVEAFIYGYIIAAVFCWIYNSLKVR